MNAFNHLDTLFERTRHGMTDAEAREMLRTMLTLHRRPPLGIKPYQAARTRRGTPTDRDAGPGPVIRDDEGTYRLTLLTL